MIVLFDLPPPNRYDAPTEIDGMIEAVDDVVNADE